MNKVFFTIITGFMLVLGLFNAKAVLGISPNGSCYNMSTGSYADCDDIGLSCSSVSALDCSGVTTSGSPSGSCSAATSCTDRGGQSGSWICCYGTTVGCSPNCPSGWRDVGSGGSCNADDDQLTVTCNACSNSTNCCKQRVYTYYKCADGGGCTTTSGQYPAGEDYAPNGTPIWATQGACLTACPPPPTPIPDPCDCDAYDAANHCGTYTINTMARGGNTCTSTATCTPISDIGNKSCDDGNVCTTDSCPVDTCINANNSNTTSCDQQFGECSVAGGTKTCSGGSYGSCSGATDPRPSTCASSASSFCYYQSFDDGCGGTTCTGSISASDGSNGVCGSSNGGIFATAPSSNLCSVGSSSIVSTASRTYSWTCYGTSGDCGGSSGSNASCSATSNSGPSLGSLVLRNSDDTLVAAEAGERNHVCQSQFYADRIVKFIVTGSDADGAADITNIDLRLGANTYNASDLTNGVATFNIGDGNAPASGNYNIEVLIDDAYGSSTGWVDTGRDFKFWNCEVSIRGAIYDGSDVDAVVCASNTGYTNQIDSGVSYTLDYRFGVTDPLSMNVNSPTYDDNGNKLMWWDTYTASITGFAGAIETQMRVIDLGTGTTTCVGNLDLSTSLVSAYSDSPSLQIDFSSVLNQDSWFQAQGGGINSKTSIINRVPITCAISESCVEAMSADNTSIGTYNNGLVAAPVISNNSGCGDSCKEGIPNDWEKESNVITDNSTYTYYLKEYNQKLSQGTTFVGDVSLADVMTGTGGTGVAFVSGDLNVGTNNAVADGKLLMIIVGQDINVDPAVDRMDGVFVANNINVGGTSADQLVINGMLYAVNGVTLGRGYTEESDNNTSPATVVKYRPDFVFNMPGVLVKILSGWKVGF